MVKSSILIVLMVFLVVGGLSCSKNELEKTDQKSESASKEIPDNKAEVVLMTLAPGHFHAALVQNVMYEQISPKV